jgi:predicted MFS family arabinose efflux permease
MYASSPTQKAKNATKAIFLVCGIALSSWAPMVPLAKDRLKLDDGSLGMLLLLFGAGAIFMMPVSGYIAHKFGSRVVMLFSGILAAVFLPLLLLIDDIILMGVALFLFGSAVGTIDVAMNSHGVVVQNRMNKPIMSSLHGLFSIGGLCGSLGLGFLIKIGLQPLPASLLIALLLLGILIWKYGDLFDKETEHVDGDSNNYPGDKKRKGYFRWIKGSVISLGLACFIVFLSEGAMLDWSALFLRENRNVEASLSGLGYAAFSVAMATMRLIGDRIVISLSEKTVVVGGALLAGLGVTLAISSPLLITTLTGFILLGIGAANIVPIFFSEAGRLKDVSPSIAIPAVTTMGYAGQLAGPAMLGFIAQEFSLTHAWAFIALLLGTVAAAYALRRPHKAQNQRTTDICPVNFQK